MGKQDKSQYGNGAQTDTVLREPPTHVYRLEEGTQQSQSTRSAPQHQDDHEYEYEDELPDDLEHPWDR